MKKPPPIPKDNSEDTDPETETFQTAPYLKLLLSVIALTVAADFFLFKISPGLGTSLFCLLLWLGLRINRPSSKTGGKDYLMFALMVTSAIQTAIEPSFSNWIVLFSLTIYASGHLLHRELSPYWHRAIEGLFGLIHIPLAFTNLWRGLRAGKRSTQTVRFQGIVKQGRRGMKIILPALIIAISFLLLFSGGNAIMGDGLRLVMDQLGEWIGGLRIPSFGRISFWILVAFTITALLGKAPRSPILNWASKRLPKQLSEPSDPGVSIWQTRVILIAVNAIFFAANSVDVIYLWMTTELPQDVNFSEFVHQGVNNLITCVILAATILLIIFQQDKKVTSARGQRSLAYLWIGQNLLLVSSVLLRLKLYVDAYQLSLARLHVACFLILVVVGFILLAIKIGRDRKFVWLINANILTVFSLFFAIQFVNDRGFVANYNCDQALSHDNKEKVLDVTYLTMLGPSAWPALRRAADNAAILGRSSVFAENSLRNAEEDEVERAEIEGWKSWQYRRENNMNSSSNLEND